MNSSILHTDKREKTYRKDLKDGSVILVRVRYDDQCHNGHNTFAITCDVYETHGPRREASILNANGKRAYLTSCGCHHDRVRTHFPELAPFLRWHLTSADGPLHYIANTVFWANEGNLTYARGAAVWPDATLDQLKDKEALQARLPTLLDQFRADVESLGFTF